MNAFGIQWLVAVALLGLAGTAHAQSAAARGGYGYGYDNYGNSQYLRCESLDGRYRECRLDGRGQVRLARQLSRTQCVEGRNWGTRGNAIWVNHGCRAEFVTHSQGRSHNNGYGWDDDDRDDRDNRYGRNNNWNDRYSSGNGARQITCDSHNHRYQVCPMNTQGGVRISRQFSSQRCIQGQSWGVLRDAVWVNHGCRAEFVSGRGNDRYGYGNGWDNGQGQYLRCESQDGRASFCRASIRRGAEVVRGISRTPCREGVNWGWDRNGVWVNGGCRAEFRVW